MGIEVIGVFADGVFHDPDPAGTIVEKQRDDDPFKFVVHVFQIFISVAVVMIDLFRCGADGPTGDTLNMALDPPAIKDTEVGNTVESGFHPAGTRGFEGAHGVVEPQIDAGDKLGRGFHIVIFQINQGDGSTHLFGLLDNALDDFFPFVVLGVGFAAEDKLEFPRTHIEQTLQVTEDQVAAFVGGSAAGKTDGQQIRIKQGAGLLVDILKKQGLGAAVRVPDLIVRDGIDPYQQFRFVGPAGQVAIEESDHEG